MSIDLHGRHALVTGGSRGIGRAVTLALAAAGADVVACCRTSGENVEALRRALKEIDGDHHVVTADVTDPDAVRALLAECGDRFGSLDVVVNNAGAISHVPVGELTLPEWHRVLEVNLTGPFLVVQNALPLLGEGSSIINVGSRAAAAGVPLRSHYTAAKAGVEGLTRSLARELGPRGIRVNTLAPGVVDTDEERKIPAAQRAEMARRYGALTALGRVGLMDEIAAVVLFLASDLSRYVTGQTVNVDGGI